MEKILTVVLALTIVLSCCAYALPATVETVENTDEAFESTPAGDKENVAELAAEEEGLIYHISFENLDTDDVPQATNLNMDDLDYYGGQYAPDSFNGA